MNKENEPINIILGDGQIGSAVKRILENSLQFAREDIDFSNDKLLKPRLHELLDPLKINSIINTIAYTNVDKAEEEKELCEMVNAKSVKILAEYCHERDIPLIHYSTDFVFDGTKPKPYIETDTPNPISHYGKTKLLGDQYIERCHDKYLIFRVSWVYCILCDGNFVRKILKAAKVNKELSIVDDQIGGLSSAHDIAALTCAIIKELKMVNEKNLWGLYNMSPKKFVSRFDAAKTMLKMAKKHSVQKLEKVVLRKSKTDNQNAKAKRPLNSRLDSSKLKQTFGIEMPKWKYSLDRGLHFLYKHYKILKISL